MIYAVEVKNSENAEESFHVTVDAEDEKAAGEQAVAFAQSEYGAKETAKAVSVEESDVA